MARGDFGGGRGGRGDSRGGFRGRGGSRGAPRGGRGARGGRGGMRGGAKVMIEPHRFAGIFIARGTEDSLVT